MHPSLRGYATAVFSEAAKTSQAAIVAEELQAVEDLFARTQDLALSLTDSGVDKVARHAVVDDLLSTRVAKDTLRTVLRAVDTEYAGDLLSAIAELAELAIHSSDLAAETVRVEEPIHGLTAWRNFASGYAAAVLSESSASELEAIEEELFRFTRIVESSPSLRSALADFSRTVDERQQVVTDLLSGKVSPAVIRLARVALQGRVRDLVSSLDWLVQLVAETRGWRIAKVRSATEIDEPGQQKLSGALQTITGAPVELQVKLDPDLIGGVLVEIGDLLVDASLSQRIEQLREHLLDTEGSQQQAKDHD